MNRTVLYEVAEGVATITLNRPERLNAMNAELLEEALEAVEAAASDDSVRAVILTGAGRGFCAGGDLGDLSGSSALGGGPVEAQVGRLRAYTRSSELLHEMPKVTIAAINGPCAGAGLAWACACDLRYASTAAVFTTAFLNAGLSGDFGGSWTLPRIVGPAKARELYLLAERFDASTAERIGLVAKVFPPEELLPFVRSLARRIVESPPLALRAIKQNLNDALEVGFTEMLERETARHVRCARSHDAAEAARAFLEKRKPAFQGR
jgi:2-(1,2-epoxy-1,2-dihydrophenyl)acetyl-CoA isomerase